MRLIFNENGELLSIALTDPAMLLFYTHQKIQLELLEKV